MTSGFVSRPKEVVLGIFIVLKKSIASAGFEPDTPASSCKHTNCCTSEATIAGLEHSKFELNLIRLYFSEKLICNIVLSFKNNATFS
jgi:hypothetical protein